MKGILEPIKYEFYTRFTDLLGAIQELNDDIEVLEINDEYVAVAYADDEGNDIEEVYNLNVVYVNEVRSTITIGEMRTREVV